MRAVLIAAVAARLRACPALRGVTVFDAPPVRSGLPHVLIEEPVLADWGAKDLRGREGRLAVTIADGGERPERLRVLLAAAEAWVPAMPPELGAGWRLVQLRFLRSRIVRPGSGMGERWTGTAEFMVRGWETER
jgi:hypothetical protein